MSDVEDCNSCQKWFYSDTVKDHFFNPRNLLKTREEADAYEADGVGQVGSPACVTGDTLIAVADGRVAVPMGQLVKEGKSVPVYCFDGDEIIIKMARNFRKTRKKSPTIQVFLDNNSSFKATLDHQLMLRDGTYKKISNLGVGTSLMPFHKVIRGGYFYIYLNNGKRIREHDLIYEFYNGSKFSFNIIDPNIHHIDENKLNNSIENLKLLSARQHSKLHGYKNKKFLKGIIRDIKGDNNPMRFWWNNASEDEKNLYRITMSFATSGNRNGRWINIPNEELLRKAYEYFIIGEQKLTAENWRLFAKENKLPQRVDARFNSFNEFKEQVLNFNHRIKGFACSGFEDVYNTTVDDFHNYAIITKTDDVYSGIVIKNCGDVMKMWIKVKDDKIKECKWQTFGCASAIASTSMLSVMVTENDGMKIEDAMKIRPKDIVERLGGLPPKKFHCSVLGDQALRKAIENYFNKKESKNMEKITKDMTIGDVVSEHPEAAQVLMSYGLHCIGCHVAANESLEDGCKAHGLSDEDIDKMVKEINEKIESD